MLIFDQRTYQKCLWRDQKYEEATCESPHTNSLLKIEDLETEEMQNRKRKQLSRAITSWLLKWKREMEINIPVASQWTSYNGFVRSGCILCLYIIVSQRESTLRAHATYYLLFCSAVLVCNVFYIIDCVSENTTGLVWFFYFFDNRKIIKSHSSMDIGQICYVCFNLKWQ